MEIILGTALGIPVAWFFYWRSQRWSDHSLREHQRQLEAQQAERERIAETRHRQLQILLAEQRAQARMAEPAVHVSAVPTPAHTEPTPQLRTRPSSASPYPECPSCRKPSWNGLVCLSCGHASDDWSQQHSFGRSLLASRARRVCERTQTPACA